MDKNENTFFYKRSIKIIKDKIVISPEVGDRFFVCKDKDVAYKSVIDTHDRCIPEYERIVGTYSSEDLGEGVSDYQICEKLTIGGKEYDFVGFKVLVDGKLQTREFYLY